MTCDDLERAVGAQLPHCGSCHEDYEEYGYAMTWIDLVDGRELHVCCAARAKALEIFSEKNAEAATTCHDEAPSP